MGMVRPCLLDPTAYLVSTSVKWMTVVGLLVKFKHEISNLRLMDSGRSNFCGITSPLPRNLKKIHRYSIGRDNIS